MGGCQSTTVDPVQKSIDKQINVDKAKDEKTIKLLLLGAGESGKSTIFKQLKILHENGYTKADREKFRDTVHSNVIENIKDLIEGAIVTKHCIPGESADLDDAVKLLKSLTMPQLNPEVTQAVDFVWHHESLQAAYKKRHEFQIADSASHFFEDLARISDPSYEPTDDDILRVRVRTTGIIEMPFTVNDVPFRLFDVGGQRTERRKWIHCFENTNAVIFVASLSEYDQVLFEDNSTNRIHEALKLFNETCNSTYFANTALLLFLNKRDLFMTKIKHTTIESCFPDYCGNNSYEDSIDYITKQFLAKNTSEIRNVYVHVTCATDKNNIAFVFDAVKDAVLTDNLEGINF
jgi:GTPase SAR1 family protein